MKVKDIIEIPQYHPLDYYTVCTADYEYIKGEKIKQYSDCNVVSLSGGGHAVGWICIHIDQIAKEMLEEQNDNRETL